MEIERKENLSVYYFIKDKFSDSPFITILDAFPEEEFTYPAISVEWADAKAINFELGSKTKLHFRGFVIDIFALTKTQRDEITFRLYNYLDDTIPVYDYDEGFPPSVSPSQMSCLDIEEKNARVIPIYSELVEKMYYRATIEFVAKRNTR